VYSVALALNEGLGLEKNDLGLGLAKTESLGPGIECQGLGLGLGFYFKGLAITLSLIRANLKAFEMSIAHTIKRYSLQNVLFTFT